MYHYPLLQRWTEDSKQFYNCFWVPMFERDHRKESFVLIKMCCLLFLLLNVMIWPLKFKLITYKKWMSGKQSETTLILNCPRLKIFLCLLQKSSMLHPNMEKKSGHTAMTKKNAGNISELLQRHLFLLSKQYHCFIEQTILLSNQSYFKKLCWYF